MSPYFDLRREPDALVISLRDDWIFSNVSVLHDALQEIDGRDAQKVVFQCGGLHNLDLSGAWVLYHRSQEFETEGRSTCFLHFKAAHFKFLKNITDIRDATSSALVPGGPAPNLTARIVCALDAVGRNTVARADDIGRVTQSVLEGITHPSRLAFAETIRQIEQTGVKAVPIVALIAFLMGLVLAYQGANQLAQFGAQVFVADLVTVAMLREMGVLLAGIMVAGRSGSAFAAAIGVMKLNEEIDALRVMGLNPDRILIAPRVIALLVSLPLLTILSMLAGIAGGLALSTTALDISTAQYLERTASSAEVDDFLVGIVKAPFFCVADRRCGDLARHASERVGG